MNEAAWRTCEHELSTDFANGLTIAMTNSTKRQEAGFGERLTIGGLCRHCGVHLRYALDLVQVGGTYVAGKETL